MTGVADKSNATRAGLKRGDWLASYNGRTLDSIEDQRAAIDAGKASGKDKIEVVVFRGPDQLILTLNPGTMGVNLATG